MNQAAALASGLLLFCSDHPVHWWWLQCVAFIPLWWSLHRARARGQRYWPLGLLLATGYSLPLLANAGVAPPIVAAVGVVLLQWPLIAMVAGRIYGAGPVLGPLGAAATITLAEVAVWYSVPIFGTAQCVVRPLSAAPDWIGFIAFTGVGGLIFVVTGVQALLVKSAADSGLRPQQRRRAVSIAVALVASAAVLSYARWTRELGATLRVAAAGWHERAGADAGIEAFYLNLFDAAHEAGARLLVTPETGARIGVTGFGWPTPADAATFFTAACTERGMNAAIGIWHGHPSRDNRIWFVSEDGEVQNDYRKAHLIPWMEDYNAGDGTPVIVRHTGIDCGGMVCQDDNFTDIGRRYGQSGTQLVAVPTNDWPDIREYHLENGIFRSIENGYAVVRAASHGVSALISPRGEVLSRHDHIAAGDRVIVADLPTGDGAATIYARLGDLPIVGACLALLLAAAVTRRRSRGGAPLHSPTTGSA